MYCLHTFTKERLLREHIPYCELHGPQRTEMSTEDDGWLCYKDVGKQHPVPYVGYADFEALGEPIEGYDPADKTIYLNKKTKYKPTGFTFKWVSVDAEENIPQITYRGKLVCYL